MEAFQSTGPAAEAAAGRGYGETWRSGGQGVPEAAARQLLARIAAARRLPVARRYRRIEEIREMVDWHLGGPVRCARIHALLMMACDRAAEGTDGGPVLEAVERLLAAPVVAPGRAA